MSKYRTHNKTKNLLDIAILTAGRVDLFEKCLTHILAEMKPEYRIHICNNGGQSPEYERIYKQLPEGSVIKRQNPNIGFGGGANIAINSGNAPLVLFVTDDIFIHPGSIDKLIRTMDDPTIALCGYKFTFPEDSTDPSRPAGKVQHIGIGTSITGEIVHPLMGWNPNNPKCNVSRDVIAVTGASFIVRRKHFSAIRGFNPLYSAGYYEDIDLCLSIRGMGLGKIWINTEATATHGVGQTFAGTDTRELMRQNRMIFRTRWVTKLPWTEWEFW